MPNPCPCSSSAASSCVPRVALLRGGGYRSTKTDFRHIVILTGAGLSAEPGLATFRDKDGIWAKYDYRQVATPEGFRANPRLVHDFYDQRRQGLKTVAPNAAHAALARLEHEHSGAVTVINPEHRLPARGRGLAQPHPHARRAVEALCALCGARHAWHDHMGLETQYPGCQEKGGMRPDVVWFGEMPYEMGRICDALIGANLFLSIGTSGNAGSQFRRGGEGERRAYVGAQS
jgi:NAD-dependent deacetylase